MQGEARRGYLEDIAELQERFPDPDVIQNGQRQERLCKN